MNQINGNGGAAPGPDQFSQFHNPHQQQAHQQQTGQHPQHQQTMAINQFESQMATSVNFACVQSLCDVLRELPLPSAAVPKSVNTKTLAPPNMNIAAHLSELSLIPHIRQALATAKEQLNEIQFIENPTPETFYSDSNIMPTNEPKPPPGQPMNSQLIFALAAEGLFFNQPGQVSQNSSASQAEPSPTVAPVGQQQPPQNYHQSNTQQTPQQLQQQRTNAPNATPGSSNSNMSGNLGDFATDLGGIEPSIGQHMNDLQMNDLIGDCDMQSSAMPSNNSNDNSRNARYQNNNNNQQHTPQHHTPQHSQNQQQPSFQHQQSVPTQQHQQLQQTPQHVSQPNSIQSPQNSDLFHQQQLSQSNHQFNNNNGGYNHIDDYSSLGDRVKNRQREAAAKSNAGNSAAMSYSSPSQYSQQSTPTQHHTPQHHTPQHHTPQHHTPQHQTPQHQTPQHQTPQNFTPQHQTPQHTPPVHQQQQPQSHQQVGYHQQQATGNHNQVPNNYYQNNFENSNSVPTVKDETDQELEQLSKRMKTEHVPTYNTVVPPPPPPNQNQTPSWYQKKQTPIRPRIIEQKPQIRQVKYEFSDADYSDAFLNQTVDIVVRFDQIIDAILATSCNTNSYKGYDDEEETESQVNGMSFNVKIEFRQLKEIVVLSNRLKQSSRLVELERKKVILFLTLLSNQLSIWLTRYKSKASATSNPDDCDAQDLKERDHFWELCFNACQSALHIMTSASPNKDPSALISVEELIEAIIDYLSHNLSSATHVSTEKASKKSKPTHFGVSKKHVTCWTQLLQLLFEFITMRPKGSLNETLINALIRISMSALFLLNNTPEIQFVSIEIVCHIFEDYQNYRMAIFDELNSSLSKIQTKKSQKKNSVLTQILIKLSCAFFQPNIKNSDGKTIPLDVSALNSQSDEAFKYVSGFLSNLLKRSGNQGSNSDTDFKFILEVLLNDLLDQLHSPHTTACVLLLHITTKLFISYLTSNQKTANVAMKNFSIDCLSVICSRFAQLFAEKEEVLSELQKTFSTIEFAEKELPKEKKKKKKGKDKNKEKEAEPAEEIPIPDEATIVKRIWPNLVEYFNDQSLDREKVLLGSLWIKYGSFTEDEERKEDFFEKLNSKKKQGMNDTGEAVIEISTAALCIQYMEFGHFTTNQKLFDFAFTHITALFSGSTNTGQKSRAMKCVSNILTSSSIEHASSLLTRADLQNAMKAALADPSTSVREATVDLIGRFVLQSRDVNLCEQYCDIIGERIMDTGISVRKRVIKILRDFFIEFPEFKKCGEIASRIVKRINDDGEGIRKLVVETCRDLWFSNVNTATIKYKMYSMVHVIETMMMGVDFGMESMQNLFDQLIKDDTVEVAGMICDCLVDDILIEDKSDSKLTLLAAINCLAMIGQCAPLLVVKHCDALQSYMSLPYENRIYQNIIIKIIQTIELLLPHMKNPAQSLLNRIRTELFKNMLQMKPASIIAPTIKCLAILTRFHTKEPKDPKDLFQRYQKILFKSHSNRHLKTPDLNPKVARAIYTCGLLIKYFYNDLLDCVDEILQVSLEVISSTYDAQTRRYAINTLGLIIEADPRICLQTDVTDLYRKILLQNFTPNAQLNEMFCNQVLDNFKSYLSESNESDANAVKKIHWEQESLKTMHCEEDTGSAQSQIIQRFLSIILINAINPSLQIRRSTCAVIHVIHTGGHVYPLMLVPTLIAISCDDDARNRSRADHVILEIERKYAGFANMRAKESIAFSALFCEKIRSPGYRVFSESVTSGPSSEGAVVSTTTTKQTTARLTTLYKMICTTRQLRRGFAQLLLRQFDINEFKKEHNINIGEQNEKEKVIISLQFLVENILFFPYSVVDEVLYIYNSLECTTSLNSTGIITIFKEIIEVEPPAAEEMQAYQDQLIKYQEYQKYIEHYKKVIADLDVTLAQQQQYYGNVSQDTRYQRDQADHQLRHLMKTPVNQPKIEGTDLEELDLENEEHFSKIHVNLNVLFNQNEKYTQLKDSLKVLYLSSLMRVLLKEIYVLKDEKITEYSSNDHKAWEKPVHRRSIDSSQLKDLFDSINVLLPESLLEMEDLRGLETQILEEWKRFRSVSIHNVDPCCKQQLLNKLFTSKAAPVVNTQPSALSAAASTNQESESGEQQTTPVKQQSRQHQTPTTPMTNTPSKKHKSSKKPKKQKKKRRRVVVSSDDENDSSDDDEDDEDYDENY